LLYTIQSLIQFFLSKAQQEFYTMLYSYAPGSRTRVWHRTGIRLKPAAKMLKIAWTLMKKHEVFDPDYLILPSD